jgi:hypothetical protein
VSCSQAWTKGAFVKVSGTTVLLALFFVFAVPVPASGASIPFVSTDPSSGSPTTTLRRVTPSRRSMTPMADASRPAGHAPFLPLDHGNHLETPEAVA